MIDQARNITSAMRQGDEFLNIGCTSHLFHNIMMSAVKSLQELDAAVRKIVKIAQNLTQSPSKGGLT